MRTGRIGLRSRIIAFFAIGATLLPIILAGATYLTTRSTLLDGRERSALDAAYINASTVRGALLPTVGTDGDADVVRERIRDLLGDLPSASAGSSSIVCIRDDIDVGCLAENSANVNDQDLPTKLLERASEGEVATQRWELKNAPILVIGIPIPAAEAEYFEVVDLSEVEGSLESLATILVGAALVTAMLGAIIGQSASRRILSPLLEVGDAASAIAADKLDTRLPDTDDPDLDGLVRSFNDMGAALQSRIERDARFASDVSHELRSPLMTLAASVEVLDKRRLEMPERSRAALDLLIDDVERFQQLVKDLLEISRFDAGREKLQLSPVLATEFVEAVARTHVSSDVPVQYNDSLEDVAIVVDKRRLLQVVNNLLDNADRYAGGATEIRLERSPEGFDGVDITVVDEGPGVKERERELIFDRFSRGSSSGRRGSDSGSGLGLSLVAEHVALHGGSVFVTDRLDGKAGSRFVVRLPTEPPAAATDEAEHNLDATGEIELAEVR